MKKYHMVKFTLRSGEAHQMVIESQVRADGTVGARMLESLLMTQDLSDFRVKLWNQGIDLLESMMIVQVCAGHDITTPSYAVGVKCYIESLSARLGL